MTTFDVRAGGPAADLTAARFEAMAAEVAQLRAALAAKDREMTEMTRRVDDLLDRESMHVYDPDMERLTTAAAMDRKASPPARSAAHSPLHTLPAPERPNVADQERTGAWVPGIEWDGFGR
ncbi:hypothetical protein AB0L82_43275 [Nocardia sp. NPDC052001]|uniref:hypothetical protein n=1 Tax=Nocardia sp. NPDC052001 TaxID=3154853 RepID=UPI003422A15A